MNLSSYNCPIWTDKDYHLLRQIRYWVGGVCVCTVSFTGLFLNLTAICVLFSRLSKHNNFNQLIVNLFVVDSVYLLLAMLFAFQVCFGFKNWTLMTIFPKFTFPTIHVMLTLSILMTVGIAHERYVAIKHPIIHRQRMLSGKFRRLNLMKYMTSVVFCAIVFNIPKFFEIELIWKIPREMNNTRDM